MAYPKPLSQKTIDRMFSSWSHETVDKLHLYYEAFSNLYGCILLTDAWKVFKQFEPKIHKREFIEFSAIARREDLPYYIYEIDEVYSDERRIDTNRMIVNKKLVRPGYNKFFFLYELIEEQFDKPYYNKPDLLEAAKHPLNDNSLRTYLRNMKFNSGKYRGKKLSEIVIISKDEKFDLEYYKNPVILKNIREKAEMPISEKLMYKLTHWINFAINPLKNTLDFFNEIEYDFESDKQAETLMSLAAEFINTSHSWRNCGYCPAELSKMMYGNQTPTIVLGPGYKKAFADGTLDKNEIISKLRKMGFEVEE